MKLKKITKAEFMALSKKEENFSPKELSPAPYFQFFLHFNQKVKMTDKLRKKLRKQYKKLIKEKYRNILKLAFCEIKKSTSRECLIFIDNKYCFATWLVKRKLEKLGFICELEKNFYALLNIHEDRLKIKW